MRSFWFPLALVFALTAGVVSSADAANGPAPAFSLRDLNNTTQTLAQYKGKVVLLNFWATWCGPCQVEMPHLEAMYKELGPKGLVVLGISADAARDASKVKPLVVSKGLTYPVLLDQQTTVVAAYNPTKTLPYNVLINRAGGIEQVFSGYNPGDEVKLKAAVEALLAKSAP
jgi:cytochrome c biogenesis protein CcmG/thiol:disulfide interchange protein DsbE